MKPMPIPEKEIYRIRKVAAHEIGYFTTEAWLALVRLFGLHFPFSEIEKIDFLSEIKQAYIKGKQKDEDTEH